MNDEDSVASDWSLEDGDSVHDPPAAEAPGVVPGEADGLSLAGSEQSLAGSEPGGLAELPVAVAVSYSAEEVSYAGPTST